MDVFVTGASGWIGSASVAELVEAGHHVTGLARSDGSAAAVTELGATPLRGDLDDLDALRAGARAAEAVLHLGFKHDFSDMAGAGRTERAALEAMAEVLDDTGKGLLIASGVGGLTPGRPVTETDRNPHEGPDAPRGGGENYVRGLADHGVRSVALRFPPTVHGAGDHGFTAVLAGLARRHGMSGYLGEGTNHWAAVHRDDAARLVRQAVEQAEPGTVVHAVAEEGVATRDIATALGRALDLPVESVPPERAEQHFGWIGGFFGWEASASSAITRDRFGWTPSGPSLLDDIVAGHYPGTGAA